MTWSDARAFAETLRYTNGGTVYAGHLATLTSAAENDFVGSICAPGTAWIGGYQDPSGTEPDGGWKWIIGEPFSFTAWHAGEPNDGLPPGTHDYMEFYGQASMFYKTWNDADEYANNFIVEFEPVPVPFAGTGNMYKLFLTPMTWADARAFAETLRYTNGGTVYAGHLATLTSQAENDFVGSICAPGTAWIGGYQDPAGAEPAGGWKWITGEPFTYTAWNAGEPNDGLPAGAHDYMEFYGQASMFYKTWNDADEYANNFIVEYEPVPVPFAGMGNLYKVFLTTMTWADARVFAETLRYTNGGTVYAGHLATLTSAAENDFVGSICAPGTAWIGGYQDPSGTEPDGGWKWITGEPFSFTAWHAGEPNDGLPPGAHDYMEFYGQASMFYKTWNDADEYANNFIVEYEPVPVPFVGTGNLYKVFLTTMTWAEARAFAETLRYTNGGTVYAGHLATLTSTAENDFVGSICAPGTAWIGGYQDPSGTEPDGGWKWITGEPFSFTAWHAGEPNDGLPPGAHDYMEFYGQASMFYKTWNDADEYANNFIVEFEQITDLDEDGLPDSWEILRFGNLAQTGSGDPDGDGVSNSQEYLDGTNPTVFDIGPMSIWTAVEVGWRSVSGTNYQVQWSVTSEPGVWHNVGSPIPGNGTTNTLLQSTRDQEHKLYRVILAP